MNKTTHLTLFLGTVTFICTLALALVNAVTLPIIAQREADLKNQGYLSVLNLQSTSGYTIEKITDLEPALQTGGVVAITVFINELTSEPYGYVYDVSKSGWEPDMKFQVGIVDGLFSGFNNITNNETPNIGRVFLEAMDDVIKGLSATDSQLVINAIQAYLLRESLGASFANVTRNSVIGVLTLIMNDYQTRATE
jgi:Na+-translocating ferredoxin:NAD+ oxidoreductase RnfG subunit